MIVTMAIGLVWGALAAPPLYVRKHGWLVFWRVWRFGGTLYLARR